MPTLLRPWKRPQREEPADQDAHLEITQEKRAGPPEPRDLFLLIPTDGGLAFRLFAFAGDEAAAAYVARLASPIDPQPRHIAFRALQSPGAPGAGGESAEAVVLVRDASRGGIVNLYSFVDMESACAYVRQEGAQGLDLRLVLVYWAAPVDLSLTDQPSVPPDGPPEPPPTPISIPLPPRPGAHAARRGQGACPTEPVADTRVRVPVALAGAVFEPAEAVRSAEAPQPSARPSLMAAVRAWGGWDGLAPLLVKAALLNEQTYEEFDRDPYALGRGRLILVLAVIAAAIGAAGSGLTSVIAHVPAFALGWAAFAFTVYSIGTQAFPGRRGEDTLPRLIRSLGLATAPALLLVLGAAPTYGPLFVLAAYMWLLATTATAIAVSLELNRDSSIIVATVGCLVLFTVSQVAPLVLV